jgi:hypothetical protein
MQTARDCDLILELKSRKPPENAAESHLAIRMNRAPKIQEGHS